MSSTANAGRQGARRDSKLKYRRLLLIRPGAVGDTIVSLPALQFLRDHAEYCEIWTGAPCVPLVQFGNRVRSIVSTGLDFLELELETPARTDMESFDQIVSWYGATRPEFRAAVADLPVTFHSALPPENCGMSAVDYYLNQVGANPGAVPVIEVESSAPPASADFIGCHPFSGSPRKNWPLQRFQQLAAESGIPFEFCAGREDPPLQHAHRFESLLTLAAWLKGAAAYVGNDSGISHLAAAVGTPVVAIFRCTSPSVWRPRGRNRVEVISGEVSVDAVRERLVRIRKGLGT